MALALLGVWFALGLDQLAVDIARYDGIEGDLEALNAFTISARSIISTITSAMLTFVGVVFSISLVALQMASSQFSPRVLRLFVRSRITKAAFSVTLATFVFALFVQLGYEDEKDTSKLTSVPLVSTVAALALVLVSLVLFVLYVSSTLRLMRVTFVMERVVNETMRVLRYRHVDTDFAGLPDGEGREVRYAGRSGAFRDVNLPRLIRIARVHGVVVEVVAEVGDFLTTGTPVFRVHGTGFPRDRRLLGCLTVGTERSMHQDAAFGLRQLTDIAIRALSPAVNDPTTAVAAIDRLHQVLASVVTEPDGATAYRDRAGHLRVVLPEPTVAGMLVQSFTEIRRCGIDAPQVTRRLSAALADLAGIAAPEHAAAVADQRRLLGEEVAAAVDGIEERLFALVPDRQGISRRYAPSTPAGTARPGTPAVRRAPTGS